MESSDQSSFRNRSRDQDEFWATNINWSTHFLRYLGGVATFCPLNSHRIKRSRASERSDQVIKDDFTNQDSCKRFYRRRVCDYPLDNHIPEWHTGIHYCSSDSSIWLDFKCCCCRANPSIGFPDPPPHQGVTIHWTGLLGWTTGLDYWTHPKWYKMPSPAFFSVGAKLIMFI